MQLSRAYIEVIDGSHDPARKLPQRFNVQFNPTKYNLNKAVQIAEINLPGLDTQILQYVRGQNEKLTLELFFDTTRNGTSFGARSVIQETEPFYQLVKIQPKSHAAPRIKFVWGEQLSFQGVAESVQRDYTLFSPQGVPLRATVNLSIREYKTLQEQITEFKLESPDYTKRHVVQRGDTLYAIAYREYADQDQWRLIAQHNGLIHPRRLLPGMVLEIPPLDPGKRS